jgi:hypothetical protein
MSRFRMMKNYFGNRCWWYSHSGNGLVAGRLHVSHRNFYTTSKRCKTEVKMFPQSIIAVKAVYSILSCILIMPKWLVYITYASTEAKESGNTKLIRAKLENESLTQIESLYKCEPNTTKGQHFGWIVLTTMAICISRLESAGQICQSTDITRDNGKIYRLKMRTHSCRQSFCGNWCQRSYLFLGIAIHRVSQNPLQALFGITNTVKGGDENQHHKKGANYGWPSWPMVSIMMARPLATKPKPGMEDPYIIGFPLCSLNDLCNRRPLSRMEGDLWDFKFQYLNW